MGWETRNGNRYYYEKKRVNGRIISKYVGNGIGSLIADKVNTFIRIRREILRTEAREQAALDREIDAIIKESAKRVKTLVDATLIASGYHKHKGEWRRKREER